MEIMRTMQAVIATAILGLGTAAYAQQPAPAAAPAQASAPAVNPFATAQTLNCSFSTYTVGGWKGVAPTAVIGDESYAFQIVVVNLKKGRAQIVGDTGARPASLVLSDTGLTVIEPTPVGLTMTTAFANGGQDGQFLAVHARHVDLKPTPSPSQHYGTCKITK
jgi:hypothetical protein